MATAGSIIERSLRLLGQIESGEVPTTDEYADALEALNAMLDSWNNEKLLCFAYQTETLTLANGDDTYTVGTSGDLNTTRPVEVLSAYAVVNNISYPITIISEEDYARIPDKTTTADFPDRMLWRPTVASSLATAVFYPVPGGTVTVKLVTRIQVAAFASTATTVTLPPGWERALTHNLAVEIAPEYETTPAPSVLKGASEALSGIKKANLLYRPKTVRTEVGEMFSPDRSNIETDQ